MAARATPAAIFKPVIYVLLKLVLAQVLADGMPDDPGNRSSSGSSIRAPGSRAHGLSPLPFTG